MTYLFGGDCELDRDRHEFRRNGRVSAIEPKVFDLLVYLVENRDRLVGRDELNQHVWRGRFVSDASLSTCIKLARQAIGDSGKTQDYIRTVPRRGFRFVGSVEVREPSRRAIPPAASDRGVEPAGPTRPDKPSTAVLPFENRAGDPTEDYFADSIAADIITILSSIPNLSPFVGRRRELRQFQRVLEDCLEAGLGQTVYIRGEAGIGKTRLVDEFQQLAEDRGFKTHASLVLDFGVGEGRDAIRALVSSLLELSLGSSDAARAAAAESATSGGLILPDHLVHLNDLLDLDQPVDLRSLYDAMDNPARNRGKRETVAELVRARFGEAPVLLKIEDLQWADRIVLDHVAHLAATVANGPAILVITSRIEGDQLDPAWRSTTGDAPLNTIELGPLRETEASELAHDFLDITSQIVKECIERAGGNPLFLEHLLRSAKEDMAEAVPGSVQSLVQARVDRLQPRDRDALQAASVLGQRFGLEGVRHLVGQTDNAAEGLFAQSLVARSEYLFAHALIRDGVYASLLTGRRRELHRRAAAWFKDRDLTPYAEHLDWAADEKAAEAYLAAAQQQRETYRYERALQLVNKALAIECSPTVKFELICFHGDLLRGLGQANKSIEAFEQAHIMANTDEQSCHADIGLAEGMRIVDQYDEAIEALDRAQAVATEHRSVRDLAQIHYLRGCLYFPLGNVDGCLKEHEQARIFARQANSPEHEARASSGLADAYYMRGRMLTASDHYQRCIYISRENGFGRIEVANLSMLGLANFYQNRLKRALGFSSAGAEAAAKVGHLRAEGNARRNIDISSMKRMRTRGPSNNTNWRWLWPAELAQGGSRPTAWLDWDLFWLKRAGPLKPLVILNGRSRYVTRPASPLPDHGPLAASPRLPTTLRPEIGHWQKARKSCEVVVWATIISGFIGLPWTRPYAAGIGTRLSVTPRLSKTTLVRNRCLGRTFSLPVDARLPHLAGANATMPQLAN